MTKDNMEIKLKKAFEHATPDVLSTVLSGLEEQKGAIITMKKQKRHHPWRRFAAMAAALALVVGMGFGFGLYRQANAIASTVSLEVNPSIELMLNQNEIVKKVVAHNADGERILAGMDLKNSDLDVAINALIGSMLRNGYLTDVANSILVSVDSEDPQRGTLLQQQVTQAVNSLLNTDSFSGSVLSQHVSSSNELKALADQHHISVGKAQLISRIIAQNSRYSFEELAALSIHELNLLSTSHGHNVEGVDSTGTASEKGYIGAEAAAAAALVHCGLTETEVFNIQVEMDYENGIMIYEVEFDTQQMEYECDVDAKSGTVLRVDKDGHEYKDYPVNPPSDPENPGMQNQITKEQAKQIALDHAGVAEADISRYECELDRDDGRVIYEISFHMDSTEYDYDIDAATGKILSWEKDADDDHRAPTTAPTQPKPTDPNPSESKPSQDTNYIGKAAAKDIALQRAGVTVSEIRDYECEFDIDGKTPVYEISFQVGNREYEVEIHAETGEVLHYESEIDD